MTPFFNPIRPKNRKTSILCVIIIISLLFCFSLPHKSNPTILRFSLLRPTTLISPNSNTLLSSSSSSPPTQQEEKYLAYLPHSGLSNQRIELSNALLLSHMLNRTLIVPPAFLGTVFGWMVRDRLTDRLEWLTTPKNFDQLCQHPTPGRLASYLQRSRCEEYRNFGTIEWTELHNFQPLLDLGLKIKFQNIVSMDSLTQELQIKNVQKDVYLHQDIQLYDWRLYQNRTEATELLQDQLNYFDSFGGKRYFKVLIPKHFERRQEKLLYLGGIFGSTRMTIVDPKHRLMKEKIADVLHYRLDTPLGETVNAIVNYLGGKGSFMSVHFRTGDIPFKKEISNNLNNFIKNMTLMVGQEQGPDYCVSMEDNLDNDGDDQKRRSDQEEKDYLALLGRNVRVYVATDHKDPRADQSELLPWFDQFPCTTTLSDLPEHLFNPLDKLRDLTNPSKPLKKFLIPIVDAMVAAHARYILTTPRSTFSKYIEELHKAWIHNK
ncbi:hypothetical protein BD770DRAFT_388295 [Pilaira anomala]|nr:hypothetical protein BD770DRAFT_388295 [Pilaira anomala]